MTIDQNKKIGNKRGLDLNNILLCIFTVLLTLKLTAVSSMSWWAVFIPMYIIAGLAALSITISILLSIAKRSKM